MTDLLSADTKTGIALGGAALRGATRRLRILHVTPYFSAAGACGGFPRLATSLAGGLAQRGHDVTVCTTDACDRSHRLSGPSHAPTAAGVNVRVFRNLSNTL